MLSWYVESFAKDPRFKVDEHFYCSIAISVVNDKLEILSQLICLMERMISRKAANILIAEAITMQN